MTLNPPGDLPFRDEHGWNDPAFRGGWENLARMCGKGTLVDDLEYDSGNGTAGFELDATGEVVTVTGWNVADGDTIPANTRGTSIYAFDGETHALVFLTSGVDATVSVTVGTTTTLPAGESATVTNSGTATDLILDFSIPQGADGPQGPAGADGEDGADGQDGTVIPEYPGVTDTFDTAIHTTITFQNGIATAIG